jgi:hypothetical protein
MQGQCKQSIFVMNSEKSSLFIQLAQSLNSMNQGRIVPNSKAGTHASSTYFKNRHLVNDRAVHQHDNRNFGRAASCSSAFATLRAISNTVGSSIGTRSASRASPPARKQSPENES